MERLVTSGRADRFGILVVTGDHRGRTGLSMLGALWRASERHYFFYELTQYLLFRLMGTTDVAALARERGIPFVMTPAITDEAAERFARELAPDLLVSVKCPQRIPSTFLSLARKGSINVHGSLLPRHAGRAPHFWALAEGDVETGSTVHYMTERFDAGHVLVQKRLPITPGATALGTLVQLMQLGGEALVEAVPLALKNVAGQPQDESARSYHSHPTRSAYRALRRRGSALLRVSEGLDVARRLG